MWHQEAMPMITHDDTTDTAPADRRRRRKPVDQLSPEQLAQRRMAEAITTYRELVAKAADGQQLTQHNLEDAAELLEMLRLPPLAWERDQQAHREMQAAQAREQELLAKFPANSERLQQIDQRLKQMDQERSALLVEHNELAVISVRQHTEACRRQGELRHTHPHLFDELAAAVKFRRQARQAQPELLEQRADPDVGWST